MNSENTTNKKQKRKKRIFKKKKQYSGYKEINHPAYTMTMGLTKIM